MEKWDAERLDIQNRFTSQLAKATADGSKKRQKGSKRPWWKDESHYERAMAHIKRYEEGETRDKDSGAHPLIHAAWRLLAIACTETGNTPPDQVFYDGKRL